MNPRVSGPLVSAGCLPLEQEGIGFALPIFVDPIDPKAMLVQEFDELSGRIRSFRRLERLEQLLVPFARSIHASVEGDAVYAFIGINGRAIGGAISEISDALRSFAREHSTRKGTVLQIAELIGSDREKKRARAEMQRTILRNSGESSARAFYEGSTLQSALWSCLLANASEQDLARKILRVRSQICATIDPNNNLLLDLEALTSDERAKIDEKAVTASILRQFDPIPARALLNPALASDTHNFQEVQDKVGELLRLIRSAGRQEERIAILLDAILLDASVGLTAVLQYGTDRAMLANWAVNELRSKLVSDYSDQKSAERFIGHLIPKLFTRHYSLSRGELLYFLAKHLAKWPTVNHAIQQALDRTAAIFVDNWRKETQALLTNARESPKSPS